MNKDNNTVRTAIVWFRMDLRLHNNPAFYYAKKCKDYDQIIYIYIWDNELTSKNPQQHLSLGKLRSCLKSLQRNLHGKLRMYQGDTMRILLSIIKKYNAESIYWNYCYEPWMIQRDDKIHRILHKQGVEVHAFKKWKPIKNRKVINYLEMFNLVS